MYNFHERLFKGNIFKELIKILFEKSGYLALPFGYETHLTTIKQEIAKNNDSRTALRIRSSPDLLIYDKENNIVKLVEAKMSTYPYPRLRQTTLENYREFWDDAILIFVVPFENVFYAQEIYNLGFKKQYDPKTDFREIQKIFPKINNKDVNSFGTIAYDLISALKKKSCEQKKELENTYCNTSINYVTR